MTDSITEAINTMREATKEIYRLREENERLREAAKAAVVHLVACEAGQIKHPFKSKSLEMLEAALTETSGEGAKNDAKNSH